MVDDIISSMLPNFSTSASASAIVTLLLLIIVTTSLSWTIARRLRRPGGDHASTTIIEVSNHAAVHRMLVQVPHGVAFRDRPAHATPSTILSQNLHSNIFSAAYGSPFWLAARRNLVAGVLHPSSLHRFRNTRARAVAGLVRSLKKFGDAAIAGETTLVRNYYDSAVFRVIAEMCFGDDVAADKLGDDGVRSLHVLQRDMLRALPGFKEMLVYPPWIGKLMYPSRWAQLVAFRQRQEEAFLPLVAKVSIRKKKKRTEEEEADDRCSNYSYVESLLELRDGDMVTEGKVVSLISEFLGNASDSTGASLEWTMANLVKHPRVQNKLRAELNSVVAVAGNGDAAAGDKFIVDEAELARMPYLRAVVLEILRRHPPVPVVMRHVKSGAHNDIAGGDGTVHFIVGEIGRDPAVWTEEDPTAFSPERFMPGGEAERVSLNCTTEVRMMPFGAGRRMCPGMKLALLHLQCFVANLVREFQWLEVEEEEEEEEGDDDVEFFAESREFPFVTMKQPLRVNLVPLL